MEKESLLRNLLFIGLIMARMCAAHCQPSLVGTYWHNGVYFMPVFSETDTSIVTATLSLHEGSGVDVWRKTGDPDVFMHPNQFGNTWTNTIVYFQDSIVHRTIDGQETLLVYGRNRTLEDVYLRYDGRSANKWYESSHGFDTLLENDIRRQIIGSYVAENQWGWLITADSIHTYSLSSLPDQQSYTYAYSIHWSETDSPERVLVLSDGRHLCFEMTAEGLDLYNGIVHIEEDGDGLEWISKGVLLCRMKKDDMDRVSVPGRWPEASERLLTRGYLEPYSAGVLRLIRNEIYARHGLRFSDQSLTDFYHAEGLWYGTALLQQPTEFTQVEQLNVELIFTIEKEKAVKRQ